MGPCLLLLVKKEEQVKYGVGLVLLMLPSFVDIDEDHAGTGL